jgi:hypothetical protein
MKKKGNRSIPDFSQKRVVPPGQTLPGDKVQPHSPPPREALRTIKPQSTSAKSGRRGT